MKNPLALLLAMMLVMALVLSACGTNNAQPDPTANTETYTEAEETVTQNDPVTGAGTIYYMIGSDWSNRRNMYVRMDDGQLGKLGWNGEVKPAGLWAVKNELYKLVPCNNGPKVEDVLWKSDAESACDYSPAEQVEEYRGAIISDALSSGKNVYLNNNDGRVFLQDREGGPMMWTNGGTYSPVWDEDAIAVIKELVPVGESDNVENLLIEFNINDGGKSAYYQGGQYFVRHNHGGPLEQVPDFETAWMAIEGYSYEEHYQEATHWTNPMYRAIPLDELT